MAIDVVVITEKKSRRRGEKAVAKVGSSGNYNIKLCKIKLFQGQVVNGGEEREIVFG